MSIYHYLCCKQCKTRVFVLTRRAALANELDDELKDFLVFHAKTEGPSHEFILLSDGDAQFDDYRDFYPDRN